MKRNLTIALATIMASTVATANTTVTVDEMSNQAPKTTIVVEKAASQEVQLPKETIAPAKTEIVKAEPTKVETVKTEVVDKELAEITPDVKPEPVPNLFDTPKAEEKKEVAKTEVKKEVKAEQKKPELTASTEDSLDLNPAATEVELPVKEVKEVKKARAHKVHAPVYEEVAYEKPMSPSEQIRAYRQKMEERNVLQLQKKIEEIRIKQELALARKLQESMNQTIKALDNI